MTSQVLTFPSWRSNWTWRDDKTRPSLYVPRFSGTFSSSFSQPNTWPNSHPSLATNVHGGYVHQNPTVSTDAAFCTPPAGNQYQCCFVLPAAAGSCLLCSVYSRHTHILSCWSKEFSLKQTEEAEAAAAAVLQFRLCVSAAVRASSYTENKIKLNELKNDIYCRKMLTQNKVAIIRSGFIHCKTDFLKIYFSILYKNILIFCISVTLRTISTS